MAEKNLRSGPGGFAGPAIAPCLAVGVFVVSMVKSCDVNHARALQLLQNAAHIICA